MGSGHSNGMEHGNEGKWMSEPELVGSFNPSEKTDGKYGKIIQPCSKPATRSNMLSWRYVGSGWSYFNGWSQWIQYFPKGQAISMMTWHFYHIKSGYLEGLSIPYCILICYKYIILIVILFMYRTHRLTWKIQTLIQTSALVQRGFAMLSAVKFPWNHFWHAGLPNGFSNAVMP